MARGEAEILALVLHGSRAKGRPTAHSDFDVYVIVSASAFDIWRGRIEALDRSEIDGRVFTLSDFEQWAGWDGPQRWDRYAMDGAKLLFDRTGQVQPLLDAKARVPTTERQRFINASLDHLVNQVYRCGKCRRDGDDLAARLEAAQAIAPLLDLVFALDEGRIRPYPKYLAWEVSTRPPSRLPLPPPEFLGAVEAILGGADLKPLQVLLRAIAPIVRVAGHGAVLDAWGPARSRGPAGTGPSRD